MAHSNNSIVTGRFSGTINKELVFREWDGKTVVAKSPRKRKGKASAEQEDTQKKFLLASKYAKAVVKNPDNGMAGAYATMLKARQNVYSRAMEDYLHPPTVDEVKTRRYRGAIGDTINITATDDFRVASVEVEIYSPDGTLLEVGNAVQNLSDAEWTYTATKANATVTGSKIVIIATDVPGNEGTKSVTL